MLAEKLRQQFKRTIIDGHGVFKYIQIEINPKDSNNEKTGDESYLIVRGFMDCPYHADILDKFEQTELSTDDELSQSYRTNCPGGGRINHDEANKKIVIYGYS